MSNVKQFTPAQREGIFAPEATVVMAAGPGSGKTTVLAERIHRLVGGGAHPSRIIVLTFTNAAARELQERIGSGTGPLELNLPYVGTLHGFALRCLREHGESIGYGKRLGIISPDSAAILLESKGRSLNAKEPIKKLLEIKADWRGLPGRPKPADVAVAAYFDELREAGIVDFDLILSEFLRLLQLRPAHLWMDYDHLLVDEVQDSAEIDWAIYRALPIHNKFYVGDQDQSLYAFRGGAPEQMLEESKRPGTRLVLLEENFRSNWEICDAANRLIRRNPDRIAKRTESIKGAGGFVRTWDPASNEGAEIGLVASEIKDLLHGELGNPATSPGEIAVLARHNSIADGFRRTLAATGFPVRKREVSDLPKDWGFARSLVELLVNPENDTLCFFYMVAVLVKAGASPSGAQETVHLLRKTAAAKGSSLNQTRKIAFPSGATPEIVAVALKAEDVTLQTRMIVAEIVKGLPAGSTLSDLALAMARQGDKSVKEEPGELIECLTFHAAKGREFDVVFVVGMEDEICPGRREDVDVAEERRAFYVALTRARRAVYLTSARSRVAKFGKHEEIQVHTPSRFLAEAAG